jgi:transglutaminase-like putative cysteine protease
MRIRAGFELSFDCKAPVPMLLMLSIRPERRPDLETPERLCADPEVTITQYQDVFGNVCSRLKAPPGLITLRSDFIIRDSGEPDPITPDAPQIPVEDLPDDAVTFLLGSRYCDTQQLQDLAWALFDRVPPGWGRVQAIVSYVHQRLTFGYHHARNSRTAWEAHEERVGVCRDFAHLAITLCRCMNIPARYCTGYMGDIGVPVDGEMDFSAWFQVWLGGAWHTFDARHDRRRIGRIMMAIGRDATDVALTTQFGPADLVGFKVVTDELV